MSLRTPSYCFSTRTEYRTIREGSVHVPFRISRGAGKRFPNGEMPDTRTEKVLIVEPNDDLRKTLVATLAEFFERDHIFVSENGVNALWQATDIFPDYVIMNYNQMNVQPDELLRRLKSSLGTFHGIILYSSESEEYEKELRHKLSRGGQFEGIIAVNMDDLIDRVQRMFSERSGRGAAEE